MRFILSALLAVAALAFEGQHEIIKAVNEANVNWVAGVNQRFDGAPLHAIKRQMGARLGAASFKQLPQKPLLEVDVSAIPASFDARVAWPACTTIGHIRDQSDCGSCWAVSAAETGSDRICISTNATTNRYLSARDLLSCCYSCGQGCDGGEPSAAWNYFVNKGIVTGGDYGDFSMCVEYPFPPCAHHVAPSPGLPACPSTEYSTPSCETSCDKNSTYGTPYAQDKLKFKTAYSVSSRVEQIQMEIMSNGPVQVAFEVYSDFLTYTSGVYKHVSGQDLGGHAVKMIGWGVENGEPYWLVVNSWNDTWGDQGLFKILRGVDECGIEDEVVAGLWV